MYKIEEELINDFYNSDNPLAKDTNKIIFDINKKVLYITSNFEYLNNIPENLFITHLDLHLPQLQLNQIYNGLSVDTPLSELSNIKLNYDNISDLILLLKERLLDLVENYNEFYGELENYEDSKLRFRNGENLIIKNGKVIDKLEFGFVDEKDGFFIQENLHYIKNKRNDTKYHFGFTDSNGQILAYNSISELDRTYPLVAFSNVNKKEEMLNMTRAFAINGAPSNLMGGLYHKTSKFLKNNTDYRYIMTYVNQNLGFGGSSFKGSSYIPIAYSPMDYMYVDGLYRNRKSILDDENFSENEFQMLPIIMLGRGLNNKDQEMLEEISEMKKISKSNYNKG
ncbi:hypothetical protein CSA08_01560 [Candidatus Gracilibacteria bacterium]|nr:MAG: hypothetical protein CSA08_01560 [Candidatus Gracilibacteria bacterium]